MYLRKILFIIVLALMIVSGICYLDRLLSLRQAFDLSNDLRPIVLLKKEEVDLYVGDEYYEPLNNLKVIALDDVKTYYKSDLDLNEQGTYKYCFFAANEAGESSVEFLINVKEREKIIEKVYIETDRPQVEIHKETDDDSKEPLVEGIKDVRIKVNSDLSLLIELLSKDIKTDQKIAIDYHEVNLSKTGIYKVYYRYGDSFREIKVEVYA